jgi:hypothetical protein
MYRLDLVEYPAGMMERLEREAAEAIRNGPDRRSCMFPKFDALMGLGAYQDAFGFVTGRSPVGAYRSIADFVLCAVFPEYEGPCRAYYAGDETQLREMLTAAEAARCEQGLLCLLGVARAIREDNIGDGAKSPVAWPALVRFVRDVCAQAPRPVIPPPL